MSGQTSTNMQHDQAHRTSIAVIGAGIGGLTAAACLLGAGFDAHVYEQTSRLGEVGAGINIGPNASRILHRLGIAEELKRTGIRPVSFDQRRWDDGRVLLRSPLGEEVEAAFGAPYYTLHRGDLHRALVDVIPADRLHLGHRFTRLLNHGDRIEARFENGASVSPDALIGADGIHSLVRHALFGPEKPRFTGCVAHRGLVAADRLVHLGLELRNQIWMGPGRHFVHYFVSAGTLVNFVAVTEEDSWLRESWVDRGEVSDVLAAFQGWHDQVLSIIEAADETYKWALFDRSPLDRWSVGRVTLLGDSCHPMLPFMGQGAAQAIEDAAALKGCLLKFPTDVSTALRLYERLRLPRASRLQGMSEANKIRFHMPDGHAQTERDAEMANGATDWSWAAIGWLYEHDAELVADRI
jgi:salicylate hydroxylase